MNTPSQVRIKEGGYKAEMEAYYIEWVDCRSSGGRWECEDEVKGYKLENAPAIGFLFDEDDENITLIMTRLEDVKMVLNTLTIQRACIKKMIHIPLDNIPGCIMNKDLPDNPGHKTDWL